MGSSLPSGCETVMERLKRASYQAAEKKRKKENRFMLRPLDASICLRNSACTRASRNDAVTFEQNRSGVKKGEIEGNATVGGGNVASVFGRGDSERAKEAWWVRGGTCLRLGSRKRRRGATGPRRTTLGRKQAGQEIAGGPPSTASS